MRFSMRRFTNATRAPCNICCLQAKAQQGAWKSALARAGGEKVLDDPKLLRRSLKRESKQREKQGKAWKVREGLVLEGLELSPYMVQTCKLYQLQWTELASFEEGCSERVEELEWLQAFELLVYVVTHVCGRTLKPCISMQSPRPACLACPPKNIAAEVSATQTLPEFLHSSFVFSSSWISLFLQTLVCRSPNPFEEFTNVLPASQFACVPLLQERVAVQQGSQAARQAKRNDNLLARRQTKLDNKKAKREKKLLRPGFEGRKEGFITGGGGGGK